MEYELEVDEERYKAYEDSIHDDEKDLLGTNIYVRAKRGDKYDSFDIILLTKESLHKWLLSRGGSNPWAEDVVALLLGHGSFREEFK